MMKAINHRAHGATGKTFTAYLNRRAAVCPMVIKVLEK